MSITDVLFGLIGGLGLFLFGMSLMSDGIKAIAGKRLKQLLTALTRHRLVAVALGAFATMLVQSSSATTVMTVGFVNAGLLTLRQALCVVLGANVGTTVTAWLVSMFGFGSFKITAYALPMIGVGFFVSMIARSQRNKQIGMILLGFGLLFIGVDFMQQTFAPIKDSAQAQALLIRLSSYPLLAVLAGTILTMLMQSSSASIMVIQVLALQGAFGMDWPIVLNLVLPFVLGDNIGTTITAQLAASRASRNARRAAMGHTIFNVIGVAYILPLVWMGVFGRFVSWLTPWELSQRTIMADMAAANTIIKVINTALFVPLIGTLEAIVNRLVPIRPEEAEEKPAVLEEHLLQTPAIAFEQVTMEIQRMAKIARKGAKKAISALIDDDRKSQKAVLKREQQTDEFQYEITSYLSKLALQPLPPELSNEIPVLLHTVNDLERIGDLAVNIMEVAERKMSQNLVFDKDALKEVRQLDALLMRMFDHVRAALEDSRTEDARLAMEVELELNEMQISLRKHYAKRMGSNSCTPEVGLVLIDFVDNVEKIGDHLMNIAQSVMGGLQWDHLDRQAGRQGQPRKKENAT